MPTNVVVMQRLATLVTQKPKLSVFKMAYGQCCRRRIHASCSCRTATPRWPKTKSTGRAVHFCQRQIGSCFELYTYIPTIDVPRDLRKGGIEPFMVALAFEETSKSSLMELSHAPYLSGRCQRPRQPTVHQGTTGALSQLTRACSRKRWSRRAAALY